MNWLKVIALVPVVVSSVEKLFTAGKGKAKQDAAVSILGDMVSALEFGVERDLLDKVAAQDALRKVIDAVVAFQNVLASLRRQKAIETGNT